jgi:hypothetical protein
MTLEEKNKVIEVYELACQLRNDNFVGLQQMKESKDELNGKFCLGCFGVAMEIVELMEDNFGYMEEMKKPNILA